MAQSWLRDQPPGPALGTAAGRELEAALLPRADKILELSSALSGQYY